MPSAATYEFAPAGWVPPVVVLLPVGWVTSPAAKRFSLVQHCCHLLKTEMFGSDPILAPPLICAGQVAVWLSVETGFETVTLVAPIFVRMSAYLGARSFAHLTVFIPQSIVTLGSGSP